MPNDKDKERAKVEDYRRVVANVVTELRSREVRDSYSSITMTECVDQALLKLEGDGKKLGRKQKLTKVRDEFFQVIDAIKSTPPSTFRFPDPDQDVNTPPDPEESP